MATKNESSSYLYIDLFSLSFDFLKTISVNPAFSKNSQEVVHRSFIDYNSGKTMQGEEHWKSLKDIIFEYANHPESKFENGNQKGLMKRRFIFNGKLVYIGKEVKNLEEQALKVPKPEQYFNEDELKKKILAMTPNEAREKGIKHRSTLKRLKDRINKEKKIKFNNKTFNRLAEIK